MRKPDNKRPGPGSKGGFKPKGKSDRKPGGSRTDNNRPYSDRPKKREDDAYAGRRERSGDAERKPRRSFSDDAERPRKREFGSGDRDSARKADNYRPFRSTGDGPRRSSGGSDEKPDSYRARRRFNTDEERPRRSAASSDDKPDNNRARRRSADSDERPRRTSSDDRPRRSSSDRDSKPRRSSDEGKSFGSFRGARGAKAAERRPRPDAGGEKHRTSSRSFEERKGSRKGREEEEGTKRVKFDDFEEGRVFSRRTEERGKPGKKGPKAFGPKKAAPVRKQNDDGLIRLNKYLSNAGVASRREADTLIQSGVVKVNGVVVDQLGHKISPSDKVTYGDAPVRSERKVYLLLNKPKDYITTTDDPQERKTVMELIAKACKERVYPVGRLDRNTTGLLLFTNDGELTTKLMHPKFNIKKIYHVSLNKGLKPEDFRAITDGLELEDGIIKADDLAFVGEGKKEIGIEIHSGRNRIVRRIFEHLGYDVLKLDRVAFAGLTKKDLPRGKHRFLTAKEIGFLQMIG